jgi:hypothetical protein
MASIPPIRIRYADPRLAHVVSVSGLVLFWSKKPDLVPRIQAQPPFSEGGALKAAGCSAWKRRQSNPPLGASGRRERALPELLEAPNREGASRVMQAMLKMGKLDITGLRRADEARPNACVDSKGASPHHERFRREPLRGGNIGLASVAMASTKSRTFAGSFSRLG